MKKVLLSLTVVVALAMTSCGESEDAKSDESNEKDNSAKTEDKKQEEKTEKKVEPSLCDCVTIDIETADADMIAVCEEMEQNWKTEFENASPEEQESMMVEIMACEDHAH